MNTAAMNIFYSHSDDDDFDDNKCVEILQEEEDNDIEIISSPEPRQQRDDDVDCVITRTRTVSFSLLNERDNNGKSAILLTDDEDSSRPDDTIDSSCSSSTSTTGSIGTNEPTSPFSFSSSSLSLRDASPRTYPPRPKKRKVVNFTAPETPPPKRSIFRSMSSSSSFLSPPPLRTRYPSAYNDNNKQQKQVCLFEEDNAKNEHGVVDLSFLAFPTLPSHPSSPATKPSSSLSCSSSQTPTSSCPPKVSFLSPRTTLAPRFHDISELELMRENSLFSNADEETESEDDDDDDEDDTSYVQFGDNYRPSSPPSITTCLSFDGESSPILRARCLQENDDDDDDEEDNDFFTSLRMKRRRPLVRNPPAWLRRVAAAEQTSSSSPSSSPCPDIELFPSSSSPKQHQPALRSRVTMGLNSSRSAPFLPPLASSAMTPKVNVVA